MPSSRQKLSTLDSKACNASHCSVIIIKEFFCRDYKQMKETTNIHIFYAENFQDYVLDLNLSRKVFSYTLKAD